MKKPIFITIGIVAVMGCAGTLALGVGGLVAYLQAEKQPEGKPQQVVTPAKLPGPGGDSPLSEIKGPKKGLRVLFVGNSHTFTHNVPDLVTKLAKDEERPLLAWAEAPGGTSFRNHWENGQVQKHLGEAKWDLVVLQDQSVMPNFPRAQRDQETLPFARKLNDKIKESGARTVLFMTWGYQHDFLPMQKRSRDAYQALADDLKADLVPVGAAWEKAHRARPQFVLWSADGNHADVKGAYLAACVFYAAFYGKTPVGNSFTAGLEADDVRFLQQTAAGAVELRPGGLAALAPGRAQ
jgi:hypothetical protein